MTKNIKLDVLIHQGENSALEFKSAQVRPDSLAKELVAFANSQGGIILLGVEDDGLISGISDFLVRIGSTNRVATQAELMRLFQQSDVFHYDRLGVERTSIRSLNLAKIAHYFERYDIDFED